MQRLSLWILLGIIVLVLILYRYQSPELHLYESETPGPTLLIVAGTHGNEPAGSVAAYQLMKYLDDHPLHCGKVIIVPNANKWGLKINLRFLPAEYFSFSLLGGSDLNRSYEHTGEEATTDIAREIQAWVRNADWVIDLHEGYDFYRLNPESMGSGIYYGNSKESKQMAHHLATRLNQTITAPEKKFVSIDWPDLDGTLRMYCNQEGKHYLLVETSGQNNIQPLSLRSSQHLFLLRQLLRELHLIQ